MTIRPTLPAIKWLLNERAMLVGEVQRPQVRIATLLVSAVHGMQELGRFLSSRHTVPLGIDKL